MGWVVAWARVAWAMGLLRWLRLFCYVLPSLSLPCLALSSPSFLPYLFCSDSTLTVFFCCFSFFFIFLCLFFSLQSFRFFLLPFSSLPLLILSSSSSFFSLSLCFLFRHISSRGLVVLSKSKSRRSRRESRSFIELEVQVERSSKSKSRRSRQASRSLFGSRSLVEVKR